MAQERPARVTAALAPGGGQTAAPQGKESDVRAITDLLASFTKAYNEKDAKALGALFTPDAEIQDEDGEVTHGREAIIAHFAGTFEENGDSSLGVETDSLRFLGTDLAIEEGTASLSTGAETLPRTNRYTVIYARQGGRWLHALIRDEPPEDDPHERLEELEWMLGEWVNESDDGIVNTSCKWSDDGSFLLRDFDVKVEGRIALRGTQRIGWDAHSGSSSGCGSSPRPGGFAEGLVSRDGDRWIIKASEIRSDGRSVSTTNAFTALGKDRILWETLERSVGGEVVPGTDQFYLVRPAPPPGK